jgi:hypothetical protein
LVGLNLHKEYKKSPEKMRIYLMGLFSEAGEMKKTEAV